VAVVFARLKLRLLANGLRSAQRLFMFLLAAAGAAWIALIGYAALVSLRGDTNQAADLTVVMFAAITLGWTVLPLLGYGSDETLDPQRLALLPLTRLQMLGGLFVASTIGIAPAATLVVLSGALVALPHDVLQTILVGLGAAGTFVLCIVASRTLVTALIPLLRSRRGRDVVVVAITLLAIAPQALRFVQLRSSGESTRHALAAAAATLRWTPFAIGGTVASEASRGHLLRSSLALAVLVVMVTVLLWLWSRALLRAVTVADSERPEARRRDTVARLSLFPRWVRWLPANRVGAVAAKDLRYFARDPRRRAATIGALTIPAIVLLSRLSAPAPSPATTLLALLAVLPASQLSLNQFGLDGAASWAYIASGDDLGSDITGKNLATALFVIPLVLVTAVVFAATSDGWAYVPLTLGLIPAVLGAVLGIGNIVSVRAPYAVPERRNPLAGNTGQGCVAMLASMGALIAEGVVLAPAAILVVLVLGALPIAAATVVAITLTNAYGVVIWLVGRRVTTGIAASRLPELLDAVAPRHAA
jgi:ABC-2 type transport system permease protein